MSNPVRLVAGAALAALVACGGSASLDEPARGYGRLPDDTPSGGIVLEGDELARHRGSLLSFLDARVSALSVEYSGGSCPSVHMRGRKNFSGTSSPMVYMDGVRAANTCILGELSTRDVKRVEVYPMGVSGRPGYEVHPDGLILLFQVDARNGRDG